MIIYGWRTKTSNPRPLDAGTCAKCGKGSLTATNAWSYFHIYWIPILPYRSKLWLSCNECKSVYDSAAKDIPAGAHPSIASAKERPPLYMFIGLILIGGAIIAGLTMEQTRPAPKQAAKVARP